MPASPVTATQSALHVLGLEAVAVAAPLLGPLVRTGAEELAALQLHRFVE